jgi:peptide methionine sulfoxide reductase msrA/msrB
MLHWPLLTLLLAGVVAGGIGVRSNRSRPRMTRSRVDRSVAAILVDDFSLDRSITKAGAGWEFVSDRMMGGVSAGRIEFGTYDGRSCLHLMGSVFPNSSGGFIEAETKLSSRGRNLDAHLYKGVRLRVKANGKPLADDKSVEGPYAIRLRTRDTLLPGQFYEASFATDGAWQEIEIPFTRFKPNALKNPLNLKALTGLAVVAAGKRLDADIFVDEIAFYKETNMYNKLTPEEERVIIYKGTEPPFSGKYVNHFADGTYTCKRCGAKLFDSSGKFHSTCGWPSFDDQIKGAVKMVPDADGVRTEILCANCGAHLGHVFKGEHLTAKNTRYCVNSISLNFTPAGQETKAAGEEKAQDDHTAKAIFASGCFWGTEYYFQKAPGVISTTVGFTGGHVDHPTYRQVCTGRTGHAESVEVVYDTTKTTYEQLAKLFFETHDFTQLNRQGPDIGKQYRSAIFYLNDEQKETAAKLIEILKKKGYAVKTELTPAGKFWPAEDYHQDYYKKNGKTPYCHIYRKIF